MPTSTLTQGEAFEGLIGEGKDYGLFVAENKPADPEDSADPEYRFVGLVDGLDFGLSNEMNSAAHRNASAHRDVTPGEQSSQINGTCYVPVLDDAGAGVEGDAGQKIIEDAAYNQTPIYWLVTTNIEGTQQKDGFAQVSNWNETLNNNEFQQADFTLENKRQPNRSVVPSAV